MILPDRDQFTGAATPLHNGTAIQIPLRAYGGSFVVVLDAYALRKLAMKAVRNRNRKSTAASGGVQVKLAEDFAGMAPRPPTTSIRHADGGWSSVDVGQAGTRTFHCGICGHRVGNDEACAVRCSRCGTIVAARAEA